MYLGMYSAIILSLSLVVHKPPIHEVHSYTQSYTLFGNFFIMCFLSCTQLTQHYETSNLVSSNCTSAELHLLCLQISLSKAAYNTYNELSSSGNSYNKWLNAHFDSGVASCLLTNRSTTINVDVPVGDCLQ